MYLLQLSCGAVYSLHKTSTRSFLQRRAEGQLKSPCEVLAELRYDLPRSYRFHRHEAVDVAVDLLRLDCSQRALAVDEVETDDGESE